jgi:hypothetical protein
MQTCKTCGIEKELTEFEFRKDNGLYRRICRECQKPARNAAAAKRRSSLMGKYKMQERNAQAREIPFLLSYEQWLAIWTDSGKLDQRGRGAEKFCMCRFGDAGSYEVGNVFIGTGHENVRAGNLGKEMTQEVRDKISKANSGKPHPWSVGERNPMHRPEVKAKMSAAIGGANHYKAMGVTTPQGFYPTAKDAANVLGIKKSTVEWRARHKKFGFSYGNNLAIA